MTTSHDVLPTTAPARPATRRGPLRLRMTEHPSDDDRLDGGWWPRSRDLATELADLVDHFPPEHGRVVRAVFSPPDWDSAPRCVPVRGRQVKVGSFPRDDTHLILLKVSDRAALRVLVVPPGATDDQGAEALLAASTPGMHSASEVLSRVTEHPDVDPDDHWHDDGGSFWGPHAVAPSYRTGA